MRRDRIALSRRHQGWIYATFAVLYLTGVVWLAAREWLGGDEFGGAGPLGPPAMKLHGAAAMVFMVLLGTLLQGHVRQAWHARRSRLTGGTMLAGSALLIASGYGLYYLGGETTRALTSVLHWGVGLILPGVLVWHVRQGRKPSVRRLPRRRRHAPRSAEPSPEERAARPRIIH